MTGPAPLPPRDEPPHTAWLRAALTEHLGVKAIALGLAVLLWFVVSARAPGEALLSVRLEPELDGSLVLVGPPPEVHVLVAGRTADLVALYATPPVVRRVVSGSAADTLVMSIAPSDVHIPTELSGAVRVLDVQPRSVTLRFSRATRRTRPVAEAHR